MKDLEMRVVAAKLHKGLNSETRSANFHGMDSELLGRHQKLVDNVIINGFVRAANLECGAANWQ